MLQVMYVMLIKRLLTHSLYLLTYYCDLVCQESRLCKFTWKNRRPTKRKIRDWIICWVWEIRRSVSWREVSVRYVGRFKVRWCVADVLTSTCIVVILSLCHHLSSSSSLHYFVEQNNT